MALADTGKAIGNVTKLLVDRLGPKTGLTVAEGRPEPTDNGGSDRQLNLFLYEASFDPSLKNLSLDEGRPAPIWLILKYLMTAFDSVGKSDTIEAHENLGEGIRALQGLNYLPLTSPIDANILKALGDNPEPLKITFDETSSDLLSNLMQGSDEKYRFSIGFQVRPVMIATGEPPSYSLLVGIDYTKSPSEVIGQEGIQIPVLPSLGPKITSVEPSKFEVNSTIAIFGADLNLSGMSIMIGSAELAVTAQESNKLEGLINGTIASGSSISAGSHPISAVQTLPTGRRRSSNLLVGDLLPTITSAIPDSFVRVNPADPTSNVFGNIDMTGIIMGLENDDIIVALYRDGTVVKVFDELTVKSPPPPLQTQLKLNMEEDDAVPPGKYRIILRVNGQQAKNSPELELIAP